jgi:hypothetical protein
MEEPWQFHGGILPDASGHSLGGQPSIAAPHPVRHTHSQSLVVPLSAHSGGPQAGRVHSQIQLPMLPQFGVPNQRLVEHGVFVQSEIKYEQTPVFDPHSYDS